MKIDVGFCESVVEIYLQAESVAESADLMKLGLQTKKTGATVSTIVTSDQRVVCDIMLPLKKNKVWSIENS